MVIEQPLCGVLREGEGVDELEDCFLFLQLSVLVAALVEHRDNVCGSFENLGKTRGGRDL